MGSLAFTINSQFFQNREAPPPAVSKKAELENPQKKDEEYNIVGLGDSLTRGIGDESGKGYAGYAIGQLRDRTEQKLQLTNLSISGQTSVQLEKQLNQPEIQRQLSKADAVIMTIGGNDLFAGGQVMEDLSDESIKNTRAAFLERLGSIFQQIRSVNPQAAVYYIGLYNPFNDLSNSKTTSGIVREWNFYTAEEAAKYKKTIVVPTFDLFEQNVNDYLYSDKFHPNSEGYQLIGERLASLILFSGGGEEQ